MLVTDIEITHYQYCPKSAQHVANVCMTLKDQIINLFCRLDLPHDEANDKRARALVADATRQLRRMPEIRSGQKTLAFSKHLRDLSNQKTA